MVLASFLLCKCVCGLFDVHNKQLTTLGKSTLHREYQMGTISEEIIPPFTARFVKNSIGGAKNSLLAGIPFVFNPQRKGSEVELVDIPG